MGLNQGVHQGILETWGKAGDSLEHNFKEFISKSSFQTAPDRFANG